MNNFIYSITPIHKILRIFNSDYFCIFIVVYWHISLFIPPPHTGLNSWMEVLVANQRDRKFHKMDHEHKKPSIIVSNDLRLFPRA